MEDDENKLECHDCSNDADLNLEISGDYYCVDCANACGNCRSVEPTDRLRWVSDELWCEECSTECQRCDSGVDRDDTYSVDDEQWCQSCYEYNTFYCNQCETSYSDHYDYSSVGDDTTAMIAMSTTTMMIRVSANKVLVVARAVAVP
jgi:hypothetical protein